MRQGTVWWLRRQIAEWGNMVFATPCPLCGRSAVRELCQDCWTQVERCQRINSLSNPSRLMTAPELQSVFAWGHYKGALKRTIAALKYDQQRQLARPLGRWLAQSWLATLATPPPPLVVVPIPLHPSKQKARGFNQAELVGRAFCDFTRLPLEPKGLIRNRATEAQFQLSPQAREQNLYDAFEVGTLTRDRTHQQAVLLLDDIYTTGATARAAIQVLLQSHIPVYGIVTVARADDPQARYRLHSRSPNQPPAHR